MKLILSLLTFILPAPLLATEPPMLVRIDNLQNEIQRLLNPAPCPDTPEDSLQKQPPTDEIMSWLRGAIARKDATRVRLILNEYQIDLSSEEFSRSLFISGGVNVLKVLIQNGLDVNAIVRGETLLSEASYRGDQDTITELLANGANPNTPNRRGSFALSIALKRGRTTVARQLLPLIDRANTAANSQAIHAAASSGVPEGVRFLVKNGFDINTRNNSGRTSLFTAIYENDENMVTELIALGADSNIANNNGVYPLTDAIRKGNLVIAEKLAPLFDKENADANAQAIHAAVSSKNLDSVKLLVRHGFDVNARNRSGQTPLYIAAKNGSSDIIAELLAHRADIDAKNGRYEETALFIAAWEDKRGAVQMLLDRNANPSIPDNEGRFPLARLIYKGRLATARILIPSANPDTQERSSQDTPLHIAAADPNRVEIIPDLLQANANTNRRNDDGETPLFLAIRTNNIQAARQLIPHTDVRRGTSPDWTPLHETIRRGHSQLIEPMLARGADPDAMVGDNAPIHIAILKGNMSALEALVTGGANIDQANNRRGTTPLLMAINNGYFQMAEFLLKRGADRNIADERGRTPLNIARRKELPSSLETLMGTAPEENLLD